MSQKRFSREGFQQLPNFSSTSMPNNSNEVTMDIPLTQVQTNKSGGARKVDRSASSPQTGSHNEKTGYFRKRAAGRRKVAKDKSPMGEDGEGDTLTHMGRVYDKILHFSVVTRYLLYVLPLAILIAIPIIIGATVSEKANFGGVRIVWIFTWVEIVWLSLWVSKLAAQALPSIFQFLCGIVSSGTRKYALVLQNLEIPLSLAGWALAALATFIPVMTRNPDRPKKQHWENIVQQILAAFMVASLIFLAEKLLIQIISISYHRTQFNQKIQESKHHIYLLSLLYDASRTLFPAYCTEFAEEDYVIHDALDIDLSNSRKGVSHARSGSATPLRLLQNVGRVGDKITSAFGNIATEVTGKEVFNPNSAHSIIVEALEKNKSSEALAKRLWMSFVVEGKDALYQEDIEEVLGADRHVEAEECFDSLDRDGNGDISLDEMILTVCEFGRERHSIANSLHDVDQAINVLDKLLCTIVFIIVVFVFLAFLNSSFVTTLATAGTALLSLSFVFSGTAQEVLGSCIFLFVKHPFDVLDRVNINTEQLVVERISLLYTVFRKANSHKSTQVPNVVLNTLWIENVSRSKAMREELLIYVHFDTTLEDIQLLRQEMQNFVRDKENCRDFQPDIEVEVTGIAEMNKLEVLVEIKHKSNWANETVRAARRSKFMCALVLALRKIPIYAPGGGDAALGSADKPTYSVTVSDEQAATARDAYAATKESKRLVPSKKPPPANSFPASSTAVDPQPDPRDPATPPPLRYRLPPVTETAALTDLNARHPAADTASDIGSPERDSPHQRTPGSSVSSRNRNNDIEEVRGMLRRQSTRGRRRPSGPTAPYASAAGNTSQGGLGLSMPPSIPETNPLRPNNPTSTSGPYVQGPRFESQTQIPPRSIYPQDHGQQMPHIRQPAPGAGNSFAQDRERSE